ncbi:hypothetical protein [Virgibacillus sp. DJP39]|uniref:hypothetical protein n=1 Tax=Virgibacillus sp. DJP39 TaxID=3409790 RepID=UPI003BB6C3F9
MGFGMVESPPSSVTFEWSGLIGSGKGGVRNGDYWTILFPLLAFVLSIFAMQFIIQGVKEMQQTKVGVIYKFRKTGRKRKNKSRVINSTYQPTKESFERVGND